MLRVKRLWPSLIAACALWSCTSVGDFGAYWDKGTLDPALEGTWHKVPQATQDGSSGRLSFATWRFTRNGSSYTAHASDAIGGASADGDSDKVRDLAARTLRIGTGRFLMLRNPVGDATGLFVRYDIRYDTQGTTLREYWLESDAALEYLDARSPRATSIANADMGRQVVIKTFDDEAFRVLTEMVGHPPYWRLNAEYRKASAGSANTGSTNKDWTSELAVPPGSSLPPPGSPQRLSVALLSVSQQREVGSQLFIAGTGSVILGTGGTVFAGPNRDQRPFLEVTIANPGDPVMTKCRALLVPASFKDQGVQITGTGQFQSMDGTQGRYLGVVRLETVSECKLTRPY